MRAAIGVLAGLAGVIATGAALAESGECARLRAAIASAPRGGGGQAAAAAARQRAELSRTAGYANAIGCNNQRFLFFGSDAPPQCGEIRGQIARMEASLADLQARSGGGREDLIARYNAECSAPQQQQPGNIFEALFGGGAKPQPSEPINPDTLSPDEQQQTIEKSIEKEKTGADVSAGSYGVCVRTCDGSFFPVSYSAGGEPAETSRTFADRCAPTPTWRSTPSPSAARSNRRRRRRASAYANLPNAGEIRRRPTIRAALADARAQSWAEALADAEARYGHEKHDILVTPREIGGDGPADHRQGHADPKAKAAKAAVVAAPGAARPRPAPRRPSEPAGSAPVSTPTARTPAQRRRRDRQPRGLGHRRRRRRSRRQRLQREAGADGRPRPGPTASSGGADSRASALARPISGRSAASSGPDSRPVNARRKG